MNATCYKNILTTSAGSRSFIGVVKKLPNAFININHNSKYKYKYNNLELLNFLTYFLFTTSKAVFNSV